MGCGAEMFTESKPFTSPHPVVPDYESTEVLSHTIGTEGARRSAANWGISLNLNGCAAEHHAPTYADLSVSSNLA